MLHISESNFQFHSELNLPFNPILILQESALTLYTYLNWNRTIRISLLLPSFYALWCNNDRGRLYSCIILPFYCVISVYQLSLAAISVVHIMFFKIKYVPANKVWKGYVGALHIRWSHTADSLLTENWCTLLDLQIQLHTQTIIILL